MKILSLIIPPHVIQTHNTFVHLFDEICELSVLSIDSYATTTLMVQKFIKRL